MRRVSSRVAVGEVVEQVEALCEFAPDWLRFIMAGGVKALRAERSIGLSIIRERLLAKLKSII